MCRRAGFFLPNFVYKSLDFSPSDRGKMVYQSGFFLLIFILYWSTVDLQCCVSFRCANVVLICIFLIMSEIEHLFYG